MEITYTKEDLLALRERLATTHDGSPIPPSDEMLITYLQKEYGKRFSGQKKTVESAKAIVDLALKECNE